VCVCVSSQACRRLPTVTPEVTCVDPPPPCKANLEMTSWRLSCHNSEVIISSSLVSDMDDGSMLEIFLVICELGFKPDS